MNQLLTIKTGVDTLYIYFKLFNEENHREEAKLGDNNKKMIYKKKRKWKKYLKYGSNKLVGLDSLTYEGMEVIRK